MKTYIDEPNMTVSKKAEGDLMSATPARRLAQTGGKCVYMIRGQVDYKLCAWSLECARCPFHQRMEDEQPRAGRRSRPERPVWVPTASVPEQNFVIRAA